MTWRVVFLYSGEKLTIEEVIWGTPLIIKWTREIFLGQGKKELLTIARAMIFEDNLLILNEATSNVNTQSEMKIHQTMKKLMKDEAAFVIARRLSTNENADSSQALVMQV